MDNTQYQQFLLERELAKKLLHTTVNERKTAYKKLYSEFFDKFPKASYDSIGNITHKIEWQMKFLKPFLHQNSFFVEIGAGNCLLSLEVSKKVKQVVAYEVAESVPHIDNIPQNFCLKVFDGVDFHELDNSIDLVYSNDVFEHLHIEDTFHHVNQYYKMLNKGGKLVIVTPNSLTGPHDISRNFSTKPEGFHMKEYTYLELREILVSNGFRKIKAFAGHKKLSYFTINIRLIIALEKIYSTLSLSLRYKLKNNPILLKLFAIKIVGEK
jgi:2-polyprenyl-3-methyl-5-hydroxy-6-metoxy-1,4-benzoquinol methylase